MSGERQEFRFVHGRAKALDAHMAERHRVDAGSYTETQTQIILLVEEPQAAATESALETLARKHVELETERGEVVTEDGQRVQGLLIRGKDRSTTQGFMEKWIAGPKVTVETRDGERREVAQIVRVDEATPASGQAIQVSSHELGSYESKVIALAAVLKHSPEVIDRIVEPLNKAAKGIEGFAVELPASSPRNEEEVVELVIRALRALSFDYGMLCMLEHMPEQLRISEERAHLASLFRKQLREFSQTVMALMPKLGYEVCVDVTTRLIPVMQWLEVFSLGGRVVPCRKFDNSGETVLSTGKYNKWEGWIADDPAEKKTDGISAKFEGASRRELLAEIERLNALVGERGQQVAPSRDFSSASLKDLVATLEEEHGGRPRFAPPGLMKRLAVLVAAAQVSPPEDRDGFADKANALLKGYQHRCVLPDGRPALLKVTKTSARGSLQFSTSTGSVGFRKTKFDVSPISFEASGLLLARAPE
jgi:hypothetical protein